MRGRFGSWLLLALALSQNCAAHGFAGSGLLHPLTGFDHALAMVAVGAWSAQLGGRAVYGVPACFMLFMLSGGVASVLGAHLRGTECLVSLSVLLLGVAIAGGRQLAVLPASLAVGVFGFCHGFAHGSEVPAAGSSPAFMGGFLLTTAGLHLVGAVGGLLLLDQRNGLTILRWLGVLTAVAGAFLVGQAR
ncbi:MAG: HupE/UreJ family protein [Janthinobacterium lividum]